MRLSLLGPATVCLLAPLAGCSFRGPSYLWVRRPNSVVQGKEVPAGDTLALSAALLRDYNFVLAEPRQTMTLRSSVLGVRWSVDSSRLATVDAGGVFRARRRGEVRILAEAKDRRGTATVRVVWPLDSISYRFAAPEVMVGDTVQLVFRAYFATGEEREEGDYLSPAAIDDDGEEHDLPLDVALFEVREGRKLAASAGLESRGIFIARQPGHYAIYADRLGRMLRAELRVRPASADRAPRFVHEPPPRRPRWSDRRPLGCFTLTVGSFAEIPDEYRMQVALDLERAAREAAFLPSTVEIDSTPVIPWAPEEGRRIGTVGDDWIKYERYWLPAGDSLQLHFNGAAPAQPTRRLTATVQIEGDRLDGWLRGMSWMQAPVTGQRIACDP